MEKKTDKKYSLNDLLIIEKAARVACMKYESTSKSYDGSIINNDQYIMFKKYNDFRNKIVSEIEERLNELINE